MVALAVGAGAGTLGERPAMAGGEGAAEQRDARLFAALAEIPANGAAASGQAGEAAGAMPDGTGDGGGNAVLWPLDGSVAAREPIPAFLAGVAPLGKAAGIDAEAAVGGPSGVPGVQSPVPTLGPVIAGLGQALAGVEAATAVARHDFILALPGLADIAVSASFRQGGAHLVRLHSEDERLQNWLAGHRRQIAQGLAAELKTEVAIAVGAGTALVSGAE